MQRFCSRILVRKARFGGSSFCVLGFGVCVLALGLVLRAPAFGFDLNAWGCRDLSHAPFAHNWEIGLFLLGCGFKGVPMVVLRLVLGAWEWLFSNDLEFVCRGGVMHALRTTGKYGCFL